MTRGTPPNQPNEPAAPAAEATWLWDPDRLRIVEADAGALAFWGAPTAQSLAARRFLAGVGVSAELAVLLPIAAEFDAYRTVLQLIAGGRARSVAASVSAEALPDGRPGLRIAHLSAGPDVARGRLLLEQAPIAIAAFDAAGRAQFRNRADLRWFAAEADTLTARLADAQAADALIAEMSLEGGASAAVSLRTRTGLRAGRATLRRIGAPEGAGLEFLAYVEEVDAAAPAISAAAPPPPPAPPPAPPGRVALLAEAALDALPVGFAVFAGAGWDLFYANPTLTDWLTPEPGEAPTDLRLAGLFGPEAATAAETGVASIDATLGARAMRVSLTPLALDGALAAAAVGPILLATVTPREPTADAPTADPSGPSMIDALGLARAVRTELTTVMGFAEALAEGAADRDVNLARAFLANMVEGGRRMTTRLEALDRLLAGAARDQARAALGEPADRPVAPPPAPPIDVLALVEQARAELGAAAPTLAAGPGPWSATLDAAPFLEALRDSLALARRLAPDGAPAGRLTLAEEPAGGVLLTLAVDPAAPIDGAALEAQWRAAAARIRDSAAAAGALAQLEAPTHAQPRARLAFRIGADKRPAAGPAPRDEA